MVLDSSAILAILLDEPERRSFNEKIESDPVRLISAATYVETALIIETRRREAGGRELDLFLYRTSTEIVPVDAEQAEIARNALRKFGRGRHRAGLNYGDAFAYALAQATGEPLLFKGGDFGLTDVAAA